MDVLEKLARRYLKAKGYHPLKVSKGGNLYTLHTYTKPDGSFDYERYRSVQETGNKQKIEKVFADEETIGFIASYLKALKPALKRGLCHGVRRGLEQKWFSERLNIEVIGTDISETATQFPNTVQWDFHEVNPEWVGAFDFVYTNSHDHAYDPKKALDAWVGQLADGGMLFLEHTMAHTSDGASELDPFGVDPHLLPFLVAKWGGGRYAVSDVLEPPHTKPYGHNKIWIFVISRTR